MSKSTYISIELEVCTTRSLWYGRQSLSRVSFLPHTAYDVGVGGIAKSMEKYLLAYSDINSLLIQHHVLENVLSGFLPLTRVDGMPHRVVSLSVATKWQ